MGVLGLGGVGQCSVGWVMGALLGGCWACRDTLELLDVASKRLGAAAGFREVQPGDVQQLASCDVLPVTRDLGDVPVILLLRRIMYLILYGSGSTCFGCELIFFICEILIVCWDAE
jgi:hypothetical protein